MNATANPEILLKKVFNSHRKQLNFLENYYSQRVNKRIKIDLSFTTPTSYYNQRTSEIKISALNLMIILGKFPKLFYSLFYTLVLHEIAHAIYTDFLPMNPTRNVLEDNRIEYHTQKWNKRAKFRLLRFAFQDLQFRDRQGRIDNKVELSLALLRTIDNSMYVRILGNSQDRIDIIKEIERLNKTYQSKDYELSKDDSNQYILIDLADQVDELLDKLIESWNKDVEDGSNGKSTEERKKGKSDNSGSGNGNETEQEEPEDTEEEEEEDTEEEEDDNENDMSDEPTGYEQDNENEQDEDELEDEQEDQTDENKTSTTSGNPEDAEDEEEKESPQEVQEGLTDEEQQELEDLMSEMLDKGRKLEKDFDNGIGKLFNPTPNNDKYEQFKISAFTTARRSGIKGSRNFSRHSGNAKQLDMKKYMRRNHVTNEKKFNKKLDIVGRGGKSASVCFYLDISGSMDGTKLLHSVNYLKSFYDQMNKYLDIRFMAFGKYTYEMTRDELDYNFLSPITEGSTQPMPIKLKPKEEIIFITDGAFHTQLPEEYLRKAHFVLVDVHPVIVSANFSSMKKVYKVNTGNLKKGLENATQHIRDMLKRR